MCGFFYLAEKERFELSRRLSRPTPLAGAPLRPLEYFRRRQSQTVSDVIAIILYYICPVLSIGNFNFSRKVFLHYGLDKRKGTFSFENVPYSLFLTTPRLLCRIFALSFGSLRLSSLRRSILGLFLLLCGCAMVMIMC